MALSQAYCKVWKRILEFCREDQNGQTGSLTAQTTLLACLRVNKTLFILTAGHLYRSPIIRNIENFFSGINQLSTLYIVPRRVPTNEEEYRDVCMDFLRAGNTKLPLLLKAEKLQILALTSGTLLVNETDRNPIARARAVQRKVIERGTSILESIPFFLPSIMPKLQSITIGNQLFPLTRLGSKINRTFEREKLPLIENSIWKLRPKYWCEYTHCTQDEIGHADDPLYHLQSYLRSNVRSPQARVDWIGARTPQVVNAHCDDFTHYFYLVPGTINRITHFRDYELRRWLWPKYSVPRSQPDGRLEEVTFDPAVDGNVGPREPIELKFEAENIPYQYPQDIHGGMADEIIKKLSDILGSSRERIIQTTDNRDLETLDRETIIEIYGLEKFHPPWDTRPEELMEAPLRITIVDAEIDDSSWSKYYYSRYTASEVEHVEETQREHLKALETMMKQLMGIDTEAGTWTGETHPNKGKVAPTIKLLLATDYPGCEACGAGKNDKWLMDPRLPPSYAQWA
ncbi:uncharacterized protein I206_106703 [Kwoniella pini CBS 10737]|uniref:Uncharacterized protein n=1 Tax=Kwoniella pini CBS 10737 TaxID=1296096 RepID=A0A1B9HTF6_9TREE|nr:uncharacterized protein I206_07408 [Kwoniella pini CBS 10737]OCF46555.1 hypothetical protein I206_07408 [Kwoniella pini CBS 10737]